LVVVVQRLVIAVAMRKLALPVLERAEEGARL
jgi:hypothetical protein